MSNNLGNNDAIDNLEKEILDQISDVVKEYRVQYGSVKGSFIGVTKNIKTKIGNIGQAKGYKATSSVHGGEWLFDLAWKKVNQDGSLNELILALESELSSRSPFALRYDFEKILISHAQYKVFLCFKHPKKPLTELIHFFEEIVSGVKSLPKDSRILVLLWDDYVTDDVIPHVILKK